jgi:hypothetical protein
LEIPNHDLKDIYVSDLLQDIGMVGALADVHEGTSNLTNCF